MPPPTLSLPTASLRSQLSSSSPCFHFTNRVISAFLTAGGHDTSTFLPSFTLLSARPGLFLASLPIQKHNLNRLGSAHGGFVCTLMDTCGSLALATKGMYSTGVSLDISTTFAKAAGGEGDEILVRGEVVTMGRNLAMTRVEIRHPVSDALLAFGSHTKFIGKAIGHAENVEFDEEGEKVIKGKPMEEWGKESVKLN